MTISSTERVTARAFAMANNLVDGLRGQVPSAPRLRVLADRADTLARELERLADEVAR
jgi:hypothetical protein